MLYTFRFFSNNPNKFINSIRVLVLIQLSIFYEEKAKKIDIRKKQNVSFYLRGDIAVLIDRKRGDVNRGIWLTRLLEKRFPKDLEAIRKEIGIKTENSLQV